MLGDSCKPKTGAGQQRMARDLEHTASAEQNGEVGDPPDSNDGNGTYQADMTSMHYSEQNQGEHNDGKYRRQPD